MKKRSFKALFCQYRELTFTAMIKFVILVENAYFLYHRIAMISR